MAEPEERAGSDRAVAVIVAHGMGQQIPFETLDSVAQGLLEAERRRDGTARATPVTAAHVSLGGQRLARVAVTLRTRDGGTRTVHVYEAYWAPFTEGQVGLRGVTGFLWRAGLNGFWNGLRPLQRWMFGSFHAFDPPIRTLVFIVTALAAVAALVVMNAAILAVAARSSLFAAPGTWPSDALRSDLATVFSAVLAGMGAFVAALMLNKFGTAAFRRVGGVLAVTTFVMVVAVTVVAGVAIPALVLVHRGARDPVFGTALTLWTARVASALVVLGVVGTLVLVVARVLPRAWREWRRSRAWFSLAVTLLFGALVALLVLEIVYFAKMGAVSPPPGAGASGVGLLLYGASRAAVIWLLLVVASAIVRSFLVQYVGDVAVYVESQTLDRYFQVRDRIKRSVRDTARAVYGAPGAATARFAYEAVFLVGHSLGSVVMYDTLNRLLWDDTTVPANESLDVAGRTRLLLTFGSPLDKTAFFFTMQKKRGSSSLREMLAATVQPIIEDARFRTFRWINVYSAWDIISGRLDYYDLPDRSNPMPVANRRDPEATTFLWAHVEYWQSPLVYDALHGEIAGWPMA